MSPVMIDVRERDEFDAEHVSESINIPLSHFSSVAPGVLNQLRDREVTVMCRSGARAKMACVQIEGLGFADAVRAKPFEGGILQWKKEGKPVVTLKKGHLPIIRQVQLSAGSLVFVGAALALWVDIRFAFLALAVGGGLTFAGASGICGMALLLAKMPWNKNSPHIQKELCDASPGAGACSKDGAV